MEKKAWTARGKMLDVDRQVIESTAVHSRAAARIFVTGEAHESYLGEAASQMLVHVNDTLYTGSVHFAPLFVEARNGTIRMTRFDPRFVWGCLHPETLVQIVEEEAKRLHVNIDPWGMDNFDFYEEMVSVMRKKIRCEVPIAWKDSDLDAYYNAVYLTSLLLFGKPGYLDIPVAEYFAQPAVADWMARIDYRELTAAEFGKLEILKEEYGKIGALTNPELHFIIDLYDRRKAL